ncbi:MAG: TetR/AcrR family transcriptional regulator [Dehalococcoidia bacterium]|nr:TetR/AcrR family transcriptional regulator [Dehalococcoidia bacterium]
MPAATSSNGKDARANGRGARERILEAASKVLAERGYQRANLDEIISLSGTSKGSFYFHFPSKEQMVVGLLDQLSARLVKKVEQSLEKEERPLRRIALAIDTLMYTFSRRRKLAQMLLVNVAGQGKAMDRKFLPVHRRFAALIQRELDLAVAAGAIPPQDTALASQMWLGALHEVILRWLLAEHPTALSEALPALRALLLRSVGVDPAALKKEPRA